ncbi:hypothetical protein [Streptomyces sp. 2P-4]|uniref:hypothetical protein n=1 Tax=Streptomyces sp. 2P-4 TaxID=2931974 RepID=UPI002540EA88|nr:hypothetical protein [Streptomyces sp. 2P-4]
METDPVETVLQAVAHALHGDYDHALTLIQPLIDEGPGSTYATLCVLAHVASRPAREQYGPGHMFAVDVQGPDGPGSVDELPPALRFAARFIAAKANGDDDTAMALFHTVAEHADTHCTGDLAAAISVVFDMATAAAGQLVIARFPQTDDPS